jgi:hypothetical protein
MHPVTGPDAPHLELAAQPEPLVEFQDRVGLAELLVIFWPVAGGGEHVAV